MIKRGDNKIKCKDGQDIIIVRWKSLNQYVQNAKGPNEKNNMT